MAFLRATGLLQFFLIGCCLFAGAAVARETELADTPATGWTAIAARALPATVTIKVSTLSLGDRDSTDDRHASSGERSETIGSGFIIDPSGFIVTNKHVIDGAMYIDVELHDGTEAPATVVSVAPLIDLALLKINVGHPLPVLKFGNGDAAKPGDPVMAIGDALGVGISLSVGVVSGTRRDLMKSPVDDYIQTDAAINHGNSGGPLVNSAGEVIGVDSTLYTNEENGGSNGVGFAISSTIVSLVVEHMLHPPPRFGWIGLYLQKVSQGISRAFNAPKQGAIVTKVEAHGAASAAGIRPGDIVMRLNDRAVESGRDLIIRIAASPIGSGALLKVWSAGKIHDVKVTVRRWSGSYGLGSANLQNPNCLPPPDPTLGLLLEPITPLERRIYDLGDTSGLLVASVNPMSEAYGRGFRPGVVIKQIDSQRPTTREEATRLFESKASRSHMISLLVQWSKGVKWISLHTGYRHSVVPLCPTNSTAASGGAATGGAAAPSQLGRNSR